MATLTTTFQSKEMSRKVSFSAIIPTSTKSLYDTNKLKKKKNKDKNKPLKTLYLLHGWDGNHEDWIQNTRIVELANKYNIAVIMPSGENSFYVDHPNHNNFGKYLCEELIDETRRLFPLSKRRSETWIAGLSMGGYGALRNGLLYDKTFSKIIALSSRILTSKEVHHDLTEDNPVNYRIRDVIRSDSYKDLPAEMDIYKLIENSKKIPDLYIACGEEDHLLDENHDLHKFLKKKKVKHFYKESPGDHVWSFWDDYIEKAIEWCIEK